MIFLICLERKRALGIIVLNSVEKVSSTLFSRPFGFQSGKKVFSLAENTQ